jgi:arsenite methyltransferase
VWWWQPTRIGGRNGCCDAGDADVREHGASLLAAYRDGVLGRAAIADGDVLLDVGTGDGLIGFAALDRVGPSGRVVFSDISADLLAGCRRRADAEGRLDRCRFVRASADDLRGIDDQSVDAVTTRSVLIYMARKPDAFAEFFRVLRPGGRLSIFEPINSFAVARADHGLFGLDMAPVADLAAKLRRTWVHVPPSGTRCSTSTNVTCCAGPPRPASPRSSWTTGPRSRCPRRCRPPTGTC